MAGELHACNKQSPQKHLQAKQPNHSTDEEAHIALEAVSGNRSLCHVRVGWALLTRWKSFGLVSFPASLCKKGTPDFRNIHMDCLVSELDRTPLGCSRCTWAAAASVEGFRFDAKSGGGGGCLPPKLVFCLFFLGSFDSSHNHTDLIVGGFI